MTTAHRPTFDPARGKEAQRGPAYHQRLLPAHTHLKLRRRGQGGVAGLGEDASSFSPARRDLQAELLKAESASGKGAEDVVAGVKRNQIADGEARDTNSEDGEDPDTKRRRLIIEEAKAEDADTDDEDKSPKSQSESESEDDEDSDDEAALRRELEKIKAERAVVQKKDEADKAVKEQEEREYEIARGNPLLNGDDEEEGFGVKRRWDDDVVFKNQARGTEQRNKMHGKEFVNDMLRSDFHKRFMSKYVR